MTLKFFKNVATTPNTPEFRGCNTRLTRSQGHSTRPQTKAVYFPLVDIPPAKPTTTLTAMRKAQKLTNAASQQYTIFKNDQKLYKVAVNITWVYNDLFISLIPHLGGMQNMMNFIGTIVTLMVETGLEDFMEAVFGGVGKMLSGKKVPSKYAGFSDCC